MLGERLGEQPGDVGRPHVLVLEVDQPAGPPDRLRVAAGHRPLPVRGEVVRRPDRRIGAQRLHDVRPALAAGRAAGAAAGRRAAARAAAVVHPGDRVVGVGVVGSSHRSRNTVSSTPTAGPAQLQLHVVPRRAFARTPRPSAAAAGRRAWSASSRREWHRSMPPAKATSRDGSPACRRTTNFWWWLPAAPHPLVEQHLAAGLLDLPVQRPVLRLAERQLVPVRAPDQPAHAHPALGRVREQLRRPWGRPARSRSSGSPRQSVKNRWSPVAERLDLLDQPGEVGRAVDQRLDEVALGPGRDARWRGCPARRR